MKNQAVRCYVLAIAVSLTGCGTKNDAGQTDAQNRNVRTEPKQKPVPSSAAQQPTNGGSTQQPKKASSTRDDPSTVIAFRNVRVFDGKDVKPSTTVIVTDQVIAEIGPGVAVPENAEVIDGRGKTLLPGFIDCHTHTFFAEHLEQAAVFGVTTELDMAGDPGFAAAMRAKQKSGSARNRADLLAAGTPVTARGGHPTQFPVFRQIPTIENPMQAQDFVDQRIAEGSDYIKIIYDDGSVYGLQFPTITRDTLQAVIRACRTRQILAVAHIATRAAARDAIAGGIDGLVHIFVDQTIDDSLIELAVERKVFVVPTLSVLQSASGVASGTSLTEDPHLQLFLNSDDADNLKRSYPRQPSSKVDYAVARDAVSKLHRAGVPILAGTDAPNPGTAHGVSIHRELELLVQAGLSPVEALAAATALPAKKFGLADRGRIAVKLRADLLLVEGNPTEEITATRKIVGVWKAGRRIDRDGFRKNVQAAIAARKKSPPVPTTAEAERMLISNFDGEKIESAFGAGWQLSTDRFVGGKSTAEFKLVRGGASSSKGSLLIRGNIQNRPQPRWAGVTFYPGNTVMSPANLSSREAIKFWAKGDGKECYVMLFFQKRGFQPSIKIFRVGNEWKAYRFKIREFDGCDGTDITAIFFGGGPTAGDFECQIDDVWIE